ncbi:MAG: hypothetical protein ABWX65_11245 [Mycetocola sp.]
MTIPTPSRRILATLGTALIAVTSAIGVGTASNATPAAATSVVASVGSSALAPTKAGGQYIYVSIKGKDTLASGTIRQYCIVSGVHKTNAAVCPPPTASHPLRTVQMAVRVAKPGDVIVVTSGTYTEKVGWGARKGTAAAPIVLQSAPGERATIAGYLLLRSAHYWTVSGLRFAYSPTTTTGESIVSMLGGSHWVLVNNEISGSRGVANLLVRDDSEIADPTAAAPHDYAIQRNCIRDNRGTAGHGLSHNIYLMPTVYSSGGLIERNLIAGAPGGSNIKAAGSSDPNGSPRDLVIRYNTVLYGASGVISGLGARDVEVVRNAIVRPQNSDARDGAFKTFRALYPGRIGVKDNLFGDYARSIVQSPGEASVFARRNVSHSGVALTGSVAGCSAKLADPTLRAAYGAQATQG